MLKSLCEAGLPEGNVYEFAALKVLKFEKKFKADQRSKELKKKYRIEENNDQNGNIILRLESREIESPPKQTTGGQSGAAGKGKK